MTFPEKRRPSVRHRMRLLMLCWAGIFVVVMAVDWWTPNNAWGALARIPFNFASVPAFTLIGFYFLGGPRHARRYWLIYRFVLANWNNVDVLVSRHTKDRMRRPRRTVYPFWWAQKR
jgi:hypothetical protein